MIKGSGKTMMMKVLWWHNLDMASLDRLENPNTNTNTNTQCVLHNDQGSGKTMTMKGLWWHNLDKASLDRRARR